MSSPLESYPTPAYQTDPGQATTLSGMPQVGPGENPAEAYVDAVYISGTLGSEAAEAGAGPDGTPKTIEVEAVGSL